LYVFIIISFGFVFIKVFNKDIPIIIVLPFILNIIFNILFTPIQFRLRNNVLALIDIFLLIVTLVWLMVSIYTYYPWVTYIQIPYLLWVLFAFVLQGEIVRRN
jgi:translocator protein